MSSEVLILLVLAKGKPMSWLVQATLMFNLK